MLLCSDCRRHLGSEYWTKGPRIFAAKKFYRNRVSTRSAGTGLVGRSVGRVEDNLLPIVDMDGRDGWACPKKIGVKGKSCCRNLALAKKRSFQSDLRQECCGNFVFLNCSLKFGNDLFNSVGTTRGQARDYQSCCCTCSCWDIFLTFSFLGEIWIKYRGPNTDLQFFSALQSYCSHLSVVKLSYDSSSTLIR